MKNKYLAEELEKVGKNTDKVWQDIITNGGSVQHLKFLSDSVKEVFKTAIELDQNVLVKQGGERQEFLCQGQSLNLFFPRCRKEVSTQGTLQCMERGCKGLYYLRTETGQRAENVSEKVERNALKDYESQAVCDITAQSQDECVRVN